MCNFPQQPWSDLCSLPQTLANKKSSCFLLFESRSLSSAWSDLFPACFFFFLCREREGCRGEEGEAVTEEASQAGDQRRQDGEQSPGESTPPLLSGLFSSRNAKTIFISVSHILLLFERCISYLGTAEPLWLGLSNCWMLGRRRYFKGLSSNWCVGFFICTSNSDVADLVWGKCQTFPTIFYLQVMTFSIYWTFMLMLSLQRLSVNFKQFF